MSLPVAPNATSPAVGGALGAIAKAVRALLPVSPALIYECNQERLREHNRRLAALNASLMEVQNDAMAAAVQLMTIDPAPRMQLAHYTDIALPHDGGRK